MKYDIPHQTHDTVVNAVQNESQHDFPISSQSLVNQVPETIHPRLKQSVFVQSASTICIPVEDKNATDEKESFAWDTLNAIVHEATLFVDPGPKFKKQVSKTLNEKLVEICQAYGPKAARGMGDQWETSGFVLLRGFPVFDNQSIKASNHLNLTKLIALRNLSLEHRAAETQRDEEKEEYRRAKNSAASRPIS